MSAPGERDGVKTLIEMRAKKTAELVAETDQSGWSDRALRYVHLIHPLAE